MAHLSSLSLKADNNLDSHSQWQLWQLQYHSVPPGEWMTNCQHSYCWRVSFYCCQCYRADFWSHHSSLHVWLPASDFFFIINPQTLPNQPQKQSQVENYPDIQFENRELTGVCVGQLYFLNLSSSFPFSCSLRPARLTRFLIQFVLAALKTGHQRNL